MKRYKVVRQHLGDILYLEGETRECEEREAKELIFKGLIEEDQEEAQEEDQEEVSLYNLKKNELLELIKQQGIVVKDNATKKEIITLIKNNDND